MAKKQQSGGYNPDLLPNTCQVPNVILDHWMATLNESEFKVVMYAVRRTYGFGRKTNKISVSQFVHGLKDKDGEVLDRGTGLGNRSVYRAINSLVEKDILRERMNKGKDGGDRAKSYSLNLRYLPPLPDETTPEEASGGGVKLADGGMPILQRGGVSNWQMGGCQNVTPLNIERNPERNPGDLPSVDPSARAPRPHEGSPVEREAGPTDRPTDGQTEEHSSTNEAQASTTMTLHKPEETHREQINAPVLFPKEDEDNAAPSAVESLRQQAEAIPTEEISDEAQAEAREVLSSLPELFPEHHERNRCRVAKLAEHYHRCDYTSVFRVAASGLALYATEQRIKHPFSYLLACCVDAAGERSEGDEDLLASLSGENEGSSQEKIEAQQISGYEWFFNDNEEEDTRKGEASARGERQHTPEPDPEALKVWEQVLEDVSGEINAPSLRVWFEGTIPVSLSADTLTVSVPNGFAKEYIESRFKELLEGALAKRLSPTSEVSPRLEIVVGVEGATDNTGMRESP